MVIRGLWHIALVLKSFLIYPFEFEIQGTSRPCTMYLYCLWSLVLEDLVWFTGFGFRWNQQFLPPNLNVTPENFITGFIYLRVLVLYLQWFFSYLLVHSLTKCLLYWWLFNSTDLFIRLGSVTLVVASTCHLWMSNRWVACWTARASDCLTMLIADCAAV